MPSRYKGHPLYSIWDGLVSRCTRPRSTSYRNYGGRGIALDIRWLDFQTFAADVERAIGPRPSRKYTLDRKDNNGNYDEANIRWATRQEQNRNMRPNRVLVVDSEAKISQDWADYRGIPRTTFHNRLKRGWTPEDAVKTPPHKKAPAGSLFPPGGREVCQQRGLNVWTVASRLRRGWSFEDALNKPIEHERGRSIKRFKGRAHATQYKFGSSREN